METLKKILAQKAAPKPPQSRTKLLEKVFPIMSTFLHNKTISKTTPLREENPFPRFNVASHKRPGIRLSFEYITTLLSGEGGEGRTGTATIFRKMLSKYTSFSTVLSKIAEWPGYGNFRKVTQDPHFLKKYKGGTKGNFSEIAQKVALVWKAQKHSGANNIILYLVCTWSAKTAQDFGAKSGSKSAQMAEFCNFCKVTKNPHFLKRCKGGTRGYFSNSPKNQASFERPKSTLAQMAL